jgi:hypothetical protein
MPAFVRARIFGKYTRNVQPLGISKPVHTCNFRYGFLCDFLLLMDVNEYSSYECSGEEARAQDIPYKSTRSHPSKEENQSKKYKRAFVNTPCHLL